METPTEPECIAKYCVVNLFCIATFSKVIVYKYCKISIAVGLDQTSIYKRNYNPNITRGENNIGKCFVLKNV